MCCAYLHHHYPLQLHDDNHSTVLGGEPTSDRGLTVTELLVRVGHYSDQSRKDGLAGLRTLFTRHPSALEHTSTLMRLFEKVAPRMHDDSASVRHEVRCTRQLLLLLCVFLSTSSALLGLDLSCLSLRMAIGQEPCRCAHGEVHT